jgi:hypothetical protein
MLIYVDLRRVRSNVDVTYIIETALQLQHVAKNSAQMRSGGVQSSI